jgi:hypothetical protein
MRKISFISCVIAVLGLVRPFDSRAAVLFLESFEDTNLASRSWYDSGSVSLSTSEHIGGSARSIEFQFNQGSSTPVSGKSLRRKFTETDSVYIGYHVKYSANWQGSNRPYHPHEIYILTNLEDDYAGPAYTHLTAYVEQNEGIPRLTIQDGKNVDETRIGLNLKDITEARAVAGCNGDSDGYGDGDCYASLDLPEGSVHWNGKSWTADRVYFQDAAGPYYKNDWHFIEAFFKLNSIQNGKGIADGQIKYWFDGELIINHENVMLRTGQHADMKFNQLMIAPYIGDGSPVTQTFWIDDLTVATAKNAPASEKKPSPPANLKVD